MVESEMTITSLDLVLGSVLIVLLLVTIAMVAVREQRTRKLHEQYGREYARALEQRDIIARAEAESQAREKRAGAFDGPLAPAQRDGFIERWRLVQAKFGDDPQGAVARADVLLTEVMEACGYPVGDLEQRAADLSVGHADIVENYRAGRKIAARSANNAARPHELRRAMIHYSALFDDLVNEPAAGEVTDYRLRNHHSSPRR
jgi:hypothetical protein